MTNDDPTAPSAPRTFSLNSQEFYDIACPRQDRPWIRNGSLPRGKPVAELKVVVEGEEGSRRVVEASRCFRGL